MIVRSYVVYWWRLGLAHLSNWTFSVFLVPPQLLGYAHAKLDLAHNITRVYYSGLRPLWYAALEQRLRSDYNIEYLNLNHLEHCEWHESYENAYNRQSKKAIRERLGLDVVELCLTKTEMEFRSKQVQIPA